MTSQRSLHKNAHNAPRAYFAFLLRQNWPALVTNFIILLLVNVVILAMTLSNDGTFYREQSYEVLLADAVEYAAGYRVTNIIIGALFAVLWGSGTMTYLNSKVSVHFYHSIPLTRGTMYVSEILSKVICYAIPAMITPILSVFVTGMITGVWHPAVTSLFISGGAYAILYFTFYLSIMVFAASFTGNAFSRLMTAGLVVFMPAALLLFWTTILQYNAVYTSYDSLYSLAAELCTPIRIVASFINDGMVFSDETLTMVSRGWETVLTVFVSLFFFAAGYLIYRKRKSELSGLPVLSKIASGIIKYTCMFCAAAAFGYMFEVFGDGSISYGIGAVIGALLAMMLINVILTKSAKQIFAGVRGLCIFCVSFIVTFVLFGVDVIGLDRHIPQAPAIDELTLTIDSEVTLTITDDEDQKFYTDAIRAYLKGNPDNVLYTGYAWGTAKEIVTTESTAPARGEMTEEVYETYIEDMKRSLLDSSRSFTVRMVIKPHFGLSVHKNFHINREGFEEFLDRIIAEEGFAAAYFPSITKEDVLYDYARLDVHTMDSKDLTEGNAWSILNGMRDSFRGAEYFQKASPASFYLRGTYEIPIEDGRTTSYSTSVRLPYFGTDFSSFDSYVRRFGAVYVLDRETMEMTKYTAQSDIRAICESVCLIQNSRYNSVFTDTDSRYAVALESVDKSDYEYGIPVFYIAHFLEGCVPSFVQ